VTVFAARLSVIVMLAAFSAPQAGPETFDVTAAATLSGGAKGNVTAEITIQIDRYSPEHALTTMTDALQYNGYPGFLLALRAAPPAGTLEVAGQKFTIRWARQIATDTGRTITFVTDQPVFFVGARKPGAKSTAGYETAVVQLLLDKSGRGVGTMAAAARVKRGGETGVRIDNYAETPLKLTAVARPQK